MASRDKKPAKPSSSRTGGIRTLSDLNRPSAHDSDSDDEPQEYYTGGEKSGMLVQDPSKGNDVNAIFNQARKLGAIEEPVEDVNSSSSSRSFTGTGRLLSGEAAPSAPAPPQQPESNVHNIVFWRNGFTVNDGPLRRLEDPENAAFLESIRKSESPKELEPADRRSSVVVKLIRRDEDCPEPEKHQVSFQGVGRTLGSGPSGGICPMGGGSGGICPMGRTTTESAAVASNSLERILDENLPTTSIQLRLGDGTRMVGQFNYHNTVGEIRAFIDSSRPGASRSYQLQTGFPPKQLTDPTQTIEQAGLANSVVVQKF